MMYEYDYVNFLCIFDLKVTVKDTVKQRRKADEEFLERLEQVQLAEEWVEVVQYIFNAAANTQWLYLLIHEMVFVVP